ncbi:peptidoglycan-binding protein [Clostridioides sp. ES-S-0108-01]|uniref:peptidoglycan-binding domain-containing protein n=1 Tax=unclassified Clostridioides TaxID=2635829 RepID=UPI001D0C14C9|nr:peptidoglycan-binding domain-containing protein [Clostridioides sp. ES-S-0107-01]MCC0785087.1 peptidoglycan-binding protein [Clostridioides sp. ES-S-0108-01]UDN53134.1 peptidoglycan-binding protein [Clostridioides sp. ES-S-0107-01]
MFKKTKKILSIALCLVTLSSTTIFADSFVGNKPINKSTKDSSFLFSIDGYTFKYENAPQELKDNYDKNCKELGITPKADSEIFVPKDEMNKYQQTYNIDDSISTYGTFNIYYKDTYFEVTGSRNYKVYTTTYVGYGYVTRGNPVHLVQLLLKGTGYSVGIDSIFGSDTYNKVKMFQSSNGLTSDGIVGLGTWQTFRSVLRL